jgi:hypothetical protein
LEKVKLQHYVPRFYLKNFAFEKANNYWLFCFDKLESRSFRVNVKNVACEKFFYESKEDEQKLEKDLSELEKSFSKVYYKLTNSRSLLSLNWEEKRILASFISAQEVRTREFREMLKSIGKELKGVLTAKKLSKSLENQLDFLDSEEKARENQSKLIAEILSGKDVLTKIFLEMKWILFENNTTIPLWTSDHPITRYNPIDQSPLGNLGLKSKGIQVFFPLNPSLGILFCDPIEYFSDPNKIVCIKDNIHFCNSLQVMWSTRHVFSIKNDFYLAKKWLEENPEFANQNRKRIQVC